MFHSRAGETHEDRHEGKMGGFRAGAGAKTGHAARVPVRRSLCWYCLDFPVRTRVGGVRSENHEDRHEGKMGGAASEVGSTGRPVAAGRPFVAFL